MSKSETISKSQFSNVKNKCAFCFENLNFENFPLKADAPRARNLFRISIFVLRICGFGLQAKTSHPLHLLGHFHLGLFHHIVEAIFHRLFLIGNRQRRIQFHILDFQFAVQINFHAVPFGIDFDVFQRALDLLQFFDLLKFLEHVFSEKLKAQSAKQKYGYRILFFTLHFSLYDFIF